MVSPEYRTAGRDKPSPFPRLDLPYVDSSGTSYASQGDYLNTHSMVLPLNTIDDSTAAFHYQSGANLIDWDPATETLIIAGLIQVVGDLHLGDLGDIQYTGSVTLYATNNIHINGDLMPTGNYLDDSGGSGTENSLGLIADGNVEIATGGGAAGVKIMAAIFAEHQTTIAKQSGLQAGRPDYSPQLA